MALYDAKKVTFNKTTSTELDLGGFASSYCIWSPDDDIYVEEDADADANSFLVPANTLYAPKIACRTIDVLGKTGSGTAYVKVIYLSEGISDAEVWASAPQKVI